MDVPAASAKALALERSKNRGFPGFCDLGKYMILSQTFI